MATALFDDTFLKQLETLSIVSRKVFAGRAGGERRSPKRGSGVEFRDYRHYVLGDDIRYIDWNIYSRLDRLILKLFVEEKDLCLHLLVDASGSMGYGDPPKIEYGLRVAAALGYVGFINLDRVAFGFLAGDMDRTIRPRRGRGQIFPMMDFLAQVRAEGRTDLNVSLRNYALRSREPGTVVVVSDLLDAKGFEDGVYALLQRGFEVLLIHLVSELELHPPLLGDWRLVDVELGASEEATVDADLLKRYGRNLRAYFDRVERFCLQNQVDYVRASTAVPFEDLILRHLRAGGFLR